MGGPEMAGSGVRLVANASEVAVVGLFEVLPRLPALRKAMAALDELFRRERPHVFVPVDFPDFHLRLARRARRYGIEVVYFVSPQVWAWRRGRIRQIRRSVRRMLVLFPFEVPFYERGGVPVRFVGHPLAAARGPEDGGEGAARRAGLDPSRPILALLPGSRPGEVRRNLPPMLEAAKALRARRPDLQVLVPVAPSVSVPLVEQEVSRSGLPGPVAVHGGDYPDILYRCTVGAVAAGTATLDAALAGLPLVAVYRMNPLSYPLARLLVRVDSIALPNLIAGRRLVPELVQGAFRPDALASALARYLDSSAEVHKLRSELLALRSRLQGEAAYERAAEEVLAVADERLGLS
jgi:lipid-A-disaccharide synthase